MITLNKDRANLDLKPFVGKKDLLIIGAGTVEIHKSIEQGEDNTFHPMTDSSGAAVLFSGNGTLYNAKIENDNGGARYRVVLVDGQVEVGVL